MNAGVAKLEPGLGKILIAQDRPSVISLAMKQVVIKPDPEGWRCQGSTVFDVAFGYVWAQ